MIRPHVLFTWMSTAAGGAEQSTILTARALGHLSGFDVTAILWDPTLSNVKPFKCDTVQLIVCSDKSSYVAELYKAITNHPAATVLFSNHRTFMLDGSIAKQVGCALGIIIRGNVISGEQVRILATEESEILEFVNWENINWGKLNIADVVVAISESVKSSLTGFVKGPKLHRIYNPVGNEWFDRFEPNTQIRPSVTFVISGRLVRWKSPYIALNAFIDIYGRSKPLDLDIIGDGPELEGLRANAMASAAKEHIHFLGWRSDLIECYASADCLVHASTMEGFGRVIAEAQSVGIPAIVCDSGAARELVRDGSTGYYFLPNDIVSCGEALDRFCSLTPAQRREMRTASHERARSMFHAQLIAGEYRAIVEKLFS